MKTAFVRVETAAEEYFGGDDDAVVERILQCDLLLFVRLPMITARVAPWSSQKMPEVGRVSRISGFFPIPARFARWPLDGTLAVVPVPWVGYRYRDAPSFEEDDRGNPETDYRAWFIANGKSVTINISRPHLMVCRSHLERSISDPATGAQPPQGWPWGGYETTLLRHLSAAADRFWKNYDPAEPDTAVTKEVVVTWLQGRGVSGRTAEQIDTILRAENLPKGPRTRK